MSKTGEYSNQITFVATYSHFDVLELRVFPHSKHSGCIGSDFIWILPEPAVRCSQFWRIAMCLFIWGI